MSSLLLVTGASGPLGQSVINHLLDTVKVPANRIVAASRSVAKLDKIKARGVAVREINFDNPASIASASVGVERALLISTDALDGTDRRANQHKAAIKGLITAGVKHILYTSYAEVAEKSVFLAGPDHVATEKALAASSIPGYTILRHHSYFENLFASIPSASKSGQWYSACAQGKTAFLARDDLGRADAFALASTFSGKRTLTLSGSEALTIDEVVAMISKTLNKPIAVVHIDTAGLVKGIVSHGLPEPIAKIYASFDTFQREGNLGKITGDYQQLTGTPPMKFSDWLAKSKAILQAM